MITSKSEPDYIFWCKLDEWTFKDAALLLHGFDPFEYKDTKFNMREAPTAPELKDTYKTFLILKNTHWDNQRFRNYLSAHPTEIVIIADRKNLPTPEKLITTLQDLQNSQQVIEATEPTETKDISARERKSLLKAIGVMALLLMEDKRFSLNNRPNAFQISEAVITKAEALKLPQEGLRSLNRKIKEALNVLDEES